MLQELAANVRELRAIHSVVPLSILKLLEVNDRAKLLAASDRYQVFKAGEIHDLWYQKKIVKDACRKASGTYAYQLPPGAGKTYPSAEISARFQKHGSTIYVCPNTAAMGDDSSGIIQKFHRMYAKLRIKARIGRVNETTTLNDVHFFTPASLLGLKRLQKSLFDRIIKEAALLVVDEAHHFMDETDGRHKIFGQIPKLANTYFEKRRKKLVAFTATYGRLDGKPLIVHTPNFKLTVQDVVNEGRCPEIHALQIFLPFKCPKARDSKLDYDLRLDGEEYEDYWRMVAGVIIKTSESNPAPFAAFVRLKTEATYLAEVFNHSSGMGDRGMAVLTSNTPMPERLRIIEKINTGKLAGYVTCGVGEEAIDIPKLEVIHFIKRTRSNIKLLQALGRGLRVAEGKERTVFVDYQVMKESVIRACNGIVQLAKICDLDPAEVLKKTNGGPIVSINGSKTAIIPGAETFGETEALIVKQIRLETHPGERRKEIVFRFAETGAERPTDTSKGEFQGEKLVGLAHLYYKVNNPKSKHHDPAFVARVHAIPNLHPSWKGLRQDRMKEREEEILKLASEGKPRPSWRGEQHRLAYSLQAWTTSADPKYKAEFDKKIRALAPRWFRNTPRYMVNHVDVLTPNVEEMITEFQTPTPSVPIATPEGHWLKTRLFSNESRSFYGRSSTRDFVEPAIIAALEKGNIPAPGTDYEDDDERAYFVTGEQREKYYPKGNESSVKPGTYTVPIVWEYWDLIDGIKNYSNRHSTGAGRRYHQEFSFYIRTRFPDCPYITPVWMLRFRKKMVNGSIDWGPEISLSPWEKWLKKRELDLFQNFDVIPSHERERQLILFAMMDSEFSAEVNRYYYYEDSMWASGQYALLKTKEQAEIADKIVAPIEDFYQRGYRCGRGLPHSDVEMRAEKVYSALGDLEAHELEALGGYASADQFIAKLLSFGEMETPLAARFNRRLLNGELAETFRELEKSLNRVATAVNDPSLFLHAIRTRLSYR